MCRGTARLLIFTAIIMAMILVSKAVGAKPHDTRSNLTIDVVAALHLPTGCMASVEYDHEAMVQAFLTDPKCLPEGKKRSHVPAIARDFKILNPVEAPLAIW